MTPLRKRMTEELQLRNLSPITAAVYLKAVERFAKYFRQPPDRLGAEEVREWLLYLINDRKVATTLVAGPSGGAAVSVRDHAQTAVVRRRDPVAQAHPLASGRHCGRRRRGDSEREPKNLKHWTIIATLYATGIRLRRTDPPENQRYRQQADGDPHPSRERCVFPATSFVSGPARATSDLLPPV